MVRKVNLFFKRSLDIVGSLVGLCMLLPVLIVVAILIKLDSNGPIVFKQERLGKNGQMFKIYKFRTMVDNAQKIGMGIFTTETDPRITKVGNILRKTSFDELPQLINVLIGNMSLVGPRPPLTYYPYKYNEYPDFQKKRFIMRPGITGLAQIKVRNSATWNVRIDYDLQYIDEFCIIKDFKILIFTIIKVIKRENVYKKSK